MITPAQTVDPRTSMTATAISPIMGMQLFIARHLGEIKLIGRRSPALNLLAPDVSAIAGGCAERTGTRSGIKRLAEDKFRSVLGFGHVEYASIQWFYERVLDENAKAVLFKLFVVRRGLVTDCKAHRQRVAPIGGNVPSDDTNSRLAWCALSRLCSFQKNDGFVRYFQHLGNLLFFTLSGTLQTPTRSERSQNDRAGPGRFDYLDYALRSPSSWHLGRG